MVVNSPSSIIAGARNSVSGFNNTLNNGNLMAKSSYTNLHEMKLQKNKGPLHRDASITIRDVVDNVLKKPAFGMEDYNPKAMVKDLLPVHTHVKAKGKRRMFCEEASKQKEKVPGANKY